MFTLAPRPAFADGVDEAAALKPPSRSSRKRASVMSSASKANLCASDRTCAFALGQDWSFNNMNAKI
jgi:hypothetical protein